MLGFVAAGTHPVAASLASVRKAFDRFNRGTGRKSFVCLFGAAKKMAVRLVERREVMAEADGRFAGKG
jgi:hypothetical protein